MTVPVCHVMPALDVAPRHTRTPMPMPAPRQLDMWSAIQTQADDRSTKTPTLPPPAKARYPVTVRWSMSHESLDLCTESLGSETGTRGDFLDQAAIMACIYAPPSHQTANDAAADPFPPPALQEEEEEEKQDDMAVGALTAVQYHRARPQRAFPPPLPSMSRRRDDDGPCLRMRPHRRDGRLVVEAVAVKPQGYLHARRQDGRLMLCFVDCASSSARGHQKQSAMVPQPKQEENVIEEEEDDVVEEEEEEEEEDEVEVVDRGTVVEVVAASSKAQRCSRIVINKFVGGAPVTDDAIQSPSRCCRAVPAAEDEAAPPAPGLRRVPSSTTTLAAAVAAASTAMEAEEDEEADDDCGQSEEDKRQSMTTMLLFTSRAGDRAELVQSVRRCRQLRQRPLFIVEPYTVIAT